MAYYVEKLMNLEDVPGTVYTRKVAMHCAWRMHKGRFLPKSIINVGVGAAYELAIWKWLYPAVPILGIDPRGPRTGPNRSVYHKGKLTFVQAVACEGESSPVVYCRKCHSLYCKSQAVHRDMGFWKDVKKVAIDDLVLGSKPCFEPPYFMWLDIEGGEVDALKGAEQTLRQTGWLCTELTNWIPGHRGSLLKLLRRKGFVLATLFSKDGLFCNESFCSQKYGILKRKKK